MEENHSGLPSQTLLDVNHIDQPSNSTSEECLSFISADDPDCGKSSTASGSFHLQSEILLQLSQSL